MVAPPNFQTIIDSPHALKQDFGAGHMTGWFCICNIEIDLPPVIVPPPMLEMGGKLAGLSQGQEADIQANYEVSPDCIPSSSIRSKPVPPVVYRISLDQAVHPSASR